MSLGLYFDHHVLRAVLVGLRLRGVDVLTAYEDKADLLADPALLDRATALGRVLFSQDSDLLREAVRRQQLGISFSGVIFVRQRKLSVGACIEALEMIGKLGEPGEFADKITYLPL